MSENIWIFVAGILTGLASTLIGMVAQHLLALRRDRIQRERDEQQRRKLQIDLKEVLRRDEVPPRYYRQESRNWNPHFLRPCFIVDNSGDSPKLLRQVRIRFVLRDAGDLAYLRALVADKVLGINGEPESVADEFPYTASFAGKIRIDLLDGSLGDPVKLTTLIRIAARDKLWLDISLETTDTWRQTLQASEKLIRYLILEFVFEERTELIRVNVHNQLGVIQHYGSMMRVEAYR